MRYFLVKQDKEYTKMPRIVNWFGKIKTECIGPGGYEQLEDDYVFMIEYKENTEYTDLVMEPFYMISNMMKYVLKVYEPNLAFTDLYLLDKKTKKAYEYYIPHLKEYDCLTAKSKIEFQGTQLSHGELDLEKLGDHSIFYLARMKKKHLVIREDLAESLLRRGFYGVNLERLDTVNEEALLTRFEKEDL